MKFYLISDNADTAMGMRLAGIEGVVLSQREEVLEALQNLAANSEIGIILMTEKIFRLCPEQIYEIKMTHKRPLIVEIPDRHGNGQVGDMIEQYITEALGINPF